MKRKFDCAPTVRVTCHFCCDNDCVLTDGRYDALVVDAVRRDDGTIGLDLTITAGDHKGELVSVVATGLDRQEFDLLAMPGTLTVENGVPQFVVDD